MHNNGRLTKQENRVNNREICFENGIAEYPEHYSALDSVYCLHHVTTSVCAGKKVLLLLLLLREAMHAKHTLSLQSFLLLTNCITFAEQHALCHQKQHPSDREIFFSLSKFHLCQLTT